jgi:hypothetical protein
MLSGVMSRPHGTPNIFECAHCAGAGGDWRARILPNQATAEGARQKVRQRTWRSVVIPVGPVRSLPMAHCSAAGAAPVPDAERGPARPWLAPLPILETSGIRSLSNSPGPTIQASMPVHLQIP